MKTEKTLKSLHMKKSTLTAAIFSIAFITPALAACGGDGNDDPAPSGTSVKVSVAPEILQTDAAAATLDLAVTADADWAVRTDADWVTLRPSGGGQE